MRLVGDLQAARMSGRSLSRSETALNRAEMTSLYFVMAGPWPHMPSDVPAASPER